MIRCIRTESYNYSLALDSLSMRCSIGSALSFDLEFYFRCRQLLFIALVLMNIDFT